MRVDAHQHYWQLSRGDYGWLTPQLTELYRDYMPDDLAALLSTHNIQHTIVVQAAPTVAETVYLLDLAATQKTIGGVVGWVDLSAVDAVKQIQTLCGYSGQANRAGALPGERCGTGDSQQRMLKGLRPMLQDITDDDWMLQPQLQPALTFMAQQKLCFEALVEPRHLANLKQFIQQNPELAVVIDHGAKPNIGSGAFTAWAEGISAIAADGKTYCKLSGLLTEAGDDWSLASIKPYVDHLLACFGPYRLLWGSDWPVLNLAADYSRWCELTDRLLSRLNDAERAAVLGLNAMKFYRL